MGNDRVREAVRALLELLEREPGDVALAERASALRLDPLAAAVRAVRFDFDAADHPDPPARASSGASRGWGSTTSPPR